MRFPRIGRTILRSRPAQRAIGWLASCYIRLVFRTTRWTRIGLDDGEQRAIEGERFVIALWHNRLAMMPFTYNTKRWRVTILASDHRDGRMVRDMFKHFNIPSIAIRSGESDSSAVREIHRAVREGSFIGITPDGPRGPRMRMKPFLVPLARLCGNKVTLVTYSVKRRIVLRSWDRFVVPLPFNRGVFIWSPGLDLPDERDGATIAAWRDELERALTDLTNRADAMMGHEPMEPAPAEEPSKDSRRVDRGDRQEARIEAREQAAERIARAP